jgi:transposase
VSKRKYQAVHVKQVVVEQLIERMSGGKGVFAVDVAKAGMYGALIAADGTVVKTVRWTHPTETRECLALLGQVRAAGVSFAVAMEPSGTYGDALRWAFQRAGMEVHRVSPKRSHDAAEVYDGVPSLHDAKSAAIIGKLFLDGASEPWPAKEDERRRLDAELRVLEIHEKQFESNRNRLEALLARYWPEVGEHLALDSATLLELLSQYGGPAAVAARPGEAAALMRRVGRGFLAPEKVDAVVACAGSTLGVPQLIEEADMVRRVAAEARRNQQEALQAKRRVEAKTDDLEATRNLAPVIGKTSAAVLVASLGSPSDHGSAEAFEKALGLNVREKSSGKIQNAGLHITKRGPSLCRMYLYFAVLRLVQEDPVFAAWYERKCARDGGKAKTKAVVALMRKLARALWHVAQGEAFDSTKLFDTGRLKLGTRPTA